MTTNHRTYRFSVTTPDGQPLFTVLISRELKEDPKPAATTVLLAPAAAARLNNGPASSGDGDPKMTEPQKRYLFRLLAQQGLDGKAAETHLKQFFHVSTLREVNKSAASQLIEQMIANQKEDRHAHA